MLRITGNKTTLCDGVSRRSFLTVGGLGLGGLTLPDLLRADAANGNRNKHKSVIMIFLPGGPSHMDIWDMKPDAPVEVRGEFSPISTSIPGIQICEHMPRLAQQMDRFAIIRSLVGAKNEHASELCYSGFGYADSALRNQPALGAAVSRLRGPVNLECPPFVSLTHPTRNNWRDPGRAGFVGSSHKPFQPKDEGLQDLVLTLPRQRLGDRRQLLASMDRYRRQADLPEAMAGIDDYTQQAFNLLTSNRLLQALDLENEDPRIRESYGKGSLDPVDDGSPMHNEDFLLARRLVEAGVTFVTVNTDPGSLTWDVHGDKRGGAVTYTMQLAAEQMDQMVSALTHDLYSRGLDKKVLVVVWGEFGRTPMINKCIGRDHWPNVFCVAMIGGGLKTGQIIGASDAKGAVPADRPVSPHDVLATMYRHLGIDPRTNLLNRSGRPIPILSEGEVIQELI